MSEDKFIERLDSLCIEAAKKKIYQLEAKLTKLKRLLLLTDRVVESEIMSELQLKQWGEFIRCFPDEDKEKEKRDE